MAIPPGHTVSARRLRNGFLHLQDGPIDVVLSAEGPGAEVAESAAVSAFDGMLADMMAEVTELRRPIDHRPQSVTHPVARRMVEAVRPYTNVFVTPMAAVAGAVADHLLAEMVSAAPDLRRAWVNDGGDIAVHLTPGQRFEVGLVSRPETPELAGRAVIRADDPVRGIATSGRHGRSLSLGIADAVTALARSAAAADVAATLIANEVDLPDHPAIRRGPADHEDPDSDLGGRPVVLGVGDLSTDEVARALDRAVNVAEDMMDRDLVTAVAFTLSGQWRTVGVLDSGLLIPPSETKKR